jgi:pimeloyl-ACP methyl ester carboxylesterase
LAVGSLFASDSVQVQAQSEANRGAFIVFVNGSGDCCAKYMDEALARIRKGIKGTVRITSYASFRDGSTTSKVPVVNLSTNEDTIFISEAADLINVIPPERPVVLIGHSYGGDSVLKVLPKITRQVQVVAVLDPVGSGGRRSKAIARSVPNNVDYFLNRWQENRLTNENIVPFDSSISGK